MTHSAAIIIPARYGSTRFPGKPLAKIAGKTMLARVVDLARDVASVYDGRVCVYVTTEDQRIADHAAEIGAACLMTGACKTGSDRALAAAQQLEVRPDFILNLQGDAPFTPPCALRALLDAFFAAPDAVSVITPVHRLSWAGLDRLRENKKQTPFSGTTVVRGADGRAIWFSKTILPAIRKEDRAIEDSPVYQHMGLYGYSFAALSQFCSLSEGHYEALEGLEQLRFLENGIAVQTVEIEAEHLQSGIDSPEDLARAEAFLAQQGQGT